MPKYIAVDFYDEPNSDIICCSDSLEECQEQIFDWIEENNGKCRPKIFKEYDDAFYAVSDVLRTVDKCYDILHQDTYGEQCAYTSGVEYALELLKKELQKTPKYQRCRTDGDGNARN